MSVPVGASSADSTPLQALDACSRFGKGRHPAALNFGDCCTYAIASLAGEPLLPARAPSQ